MKVIKIVLVILLLLILGFFIGYLCVCCSRVNSDPDVTELYDSYFMGDDNQYVYLGPQFSGSYFRLESYSKNVQYYYDDISYEEGFITFTIGEDDIIVHADDSDTLYYKEGKIYLSRISKLN